MKQVKRRASITGWVFFFILLVCEWPLTMFSFQIGGSISTHFWEPYYGFIFSNEVELIALLFASIFLFFSHLFILGIARIFTRASVKKYIFMPVLIFMLLSGLIVIHDHMNDGWFTDFGEWLFSIYFLVFAQFVIATMVIPYLFRLVIKQITKKEERV